MTFINEIICADVLDGLKMLPDQCVDMCVTSPPYYGLRDYGVKGQIGLEETPEDYIHKLVCVFRDVRRVIRQDGTLWINIGDSYAGGSGRWGGTNKLSEFQAKSVGSLTQIPHSKIWDHPVIKTKDMIGIPWMLAFALRADGWFLRQDIIWHKPNPMPESVTDRCTKSHEYLFLLSKNQKYYFDNKAIMEPAHYDGRKDTRSKGSHKYSQGNIYATSRPQTFAARGHERWQQDEDGNYLRNKRSVWTVSPEPFSAAHFATFPTALIRPCVLAGSRPGGIVLDPFFGAGTTGLVAIEEGRNYIGIELNPEYVELAKNRLNGAQPPLLFEGTNDRA